MTKITMQEYFNEVGESFSLDEIKDSESRLAEGITNEQATKYNIKGCLVTYLEGAAAGIITLNPVCWANTDYYISDTMYKEDDVNKEWPYRVFVGKID